MYVSISNQAYVFIYSMLGGMITAIIYDIFRISRKNIKTSNLVVYVEDILYWIIAGAIILFMLFRVNEGEIRGYVLLGITVGALMYSIFLSYYFIKLFQAIVRLVKRIISILLTPFKILIKLLIIPVKVLFLCLKKMKKLLMKIYLPLKSHIALKFKILKKIRKCL